LETIIFYELLSLALHTSSTKDFTNSLPSTPENTPPRHTNDHPPFQNMDVATTADFQPETPKALAVTGKEALMDAMEDIVFGSVSHPGSFGLTV